MPPFPPAAGRPAVVLAHSPLTGPAAWGHLPSVLTGRGWDVTVLDVTDDDRPPYASRYIARAALQVAASVPGDRGRPSSPSSPGNAVFLVGHSGAGYLLPQLGAARRSARRAVAGYVFLDAGIPRAGDPTRLDLLRTEDPEAAEGLTVLLAAGGSYPAWTAEDLRALVPDDDLRTALVASLRPRGEDFFTEPLPFPDDWPEAPCGLVALSSSYDGAARSARARGWPVVEPDLAGGHFAACADPVGVADALREVLELM